MAAGNSILPWNTTAFQNSSQITPTPSSSGGQLLGWIIAEILTCSLGVAWNLLLLLAVLIHGPLRQPSSSLLIAHCVLIDLYTCSVAVPVGAIPVYLGPSHPRSVEFCRFTPLWIYLIYPAQAWAATVLAFHRLVATVAPVQFARMKQKTVIAFMLTVPWYVAFFIVGFQVVGTSRYKMIPGEAGGCRYFVGNQLAAFLSSIFGTYVPIAVTGVCYAIFLLKTLLDSQRRIGSPVLRRRIEISRALMLCFLWHCVTLIPVVIITSAFSSAYGANLGLRLGIKWLLDSFGAFNPVFCWVASPLFQNGVKEVLGCGWRFGGILNQTVQPYSQDTEGSKATPVSSMAVQMTAMGPKSNRTRETG